MNPLERLNISIPMPPMALNNESVIDLTNGSFSLVNHRNLDNVVINLDTDDSFREEANNRVHNVARVRRRRIKTRATVGPDTPVHDLCTPEIKNKRKSKRSQKESGTPTSKEKTLGEPEEKKSKQQPLFCPICFDEFCGQPLASTKCGHVFCLNCIKMATSKKDALCPTCRTILRGKSKYHPIFL